MKNPFRLLLLFLFGSAIFIGSYFGGLQINEMLALDGFFEELTQPWLFHLISLKLLVFVCFLFFHGNRFRYLLNTVALILANSAALAFLDYQRSLSDQYWVYLIIFGLEWILFFIAGLIYNAGARQENNKYVDAKPEGSEQTEAVPAKGIDVVQPVVPVQKELEAVQPVVSVQEELDQSWTTLLRETEERETTSKPQETIVEQVEVPIKEPSFEGKEEKPPQIVNLQSHELERKGSADEKSNSYPIRIDIDMNDLKKYFEQYQRLTSKDEEIRLESKEIELQNKLEALSQKEKELHDRIAVVKGKEKIIEKTIDNLEQISKTIKDRTALLEEKEQHIRRQMEWIEEREDGYKTVVQNKIYDLLFEDLDLMDHEVKLKDEYQEIIIDKDDLSEIRRTIEETMDEARRGMES